MYKEYNIKICLLILIVIVKLKKKCGKINGIKLYI